MASEFFCLGTAWGLLGYPWAPFAHRRLLQRLPVSGAQRHAKPLRPDRRRARQAKNSGASRTPASPAHAHATSYDRCSEPPHPSRASSSAMTPSNASTSALHGTNPPGTPWHAPAAAQHAPGRHGSTHSEGICRSGGTPRRFRGKSHRCGGRRHSSGGGQPRCGGGSSRPAPSRPRALRRLDVLGHDDIDPEAEDVGDCDVALVHRRGHLDLADLAHHVEDAVLGDHSREAHAGQRQPPHRR